MRDQSESDYNANGNDRGLMAPERPHRVPYGSGRIMILQALGDIRSGLASGLSFRTIFEQLGDRLPGMSYRQFLRYGNRVRAGMTDSDLDAVLPRRTVDPLPSATPVPFDYSTGRPSGPPVDMPRPGQASSPRQTEKTDGPKAPPRPRGFVRRTGIPDDNKDKLV